MRRVARITEQLVDESFSLVFAWVVQKLSHLSHGWNDAGQIEVCAPQELRIVCNGRRLDAVLFPAGGKQRINALDQ